MKAVYIYHISRIPSGKKGGVYKNIPPEILGSFLIDDLFKDNDFNKSPNGELILANSIGTMGNMARNSLLRSSLSKEIIATTIDFQCGGTYKAIQMASALIISGQRDWVIAGGIESNSLQAERNYHINDPRRKDDGTISVADFTPYPSNSLAASAKELALKYQISKSDMLDWMFRSHQRSKKNFQIGVFKKYVVPFEEGLAQDESIHLNLSKQLLERAQSSYLIDRTNTADFHDGAGIVLLANEDYGKKCGLNPICKISNMSFVGVDPNDSPEGVILASKALLGGDSIDLFEICESYAVKPLAFAKEFNIPLNSINILGSNLAMGHPFAASGVINILNLYLGLKQENKKRGMVAAGVAGGLGVSMILEII